LSTHSRSRPASGKDLDRLTPVTVFPGTRADHGTRICSRCFARNVAGETFCKVCGDELPTTSTSLDLGATRRVDVAASKATLLVHGDAEAPSDIAIVLDKDISLIGRASYSDNVKPDVDLAPFDANNYVSRRHAFILRRQGAIVLEDLESVNGTFVNVTQQLAAHVLTSLRDGDEITFGQTRCTIRIDSSPAA
jgi:hypothetical protein